MNLAVLRVRHVRQGRIHLSRAVQVVRLVLLESIRILLVHRRAPSVKVVQRNQIQEKHRVKNVKTVFIVQQMGRQHVLNARK